ncbi:interferon gamma receptor 1 [Acanthochromis polyacanthus]|uniref:interferon gamma receptor 1 n=1 Tax=Acanthochromis polyacanthus TaxID=80966 RepID=UPI0022345C9C|nr:interferon gamma receptor 1 [Acanthochromis polyacanthus]
MLPDGAFTVLLLLVGGVSAVPVPPPTNVNVICHNAKVSVSWDYSELQPHTTFWVNVSGSSGNREENRTTDRQFDLSHFVWKSEENYNGFLYVTVSAIQGEKESEGVQSNSFSFNYLKTVDTRCYLDFPPVDVKEDGSGATVSFPNPVHFYKELETDAAHVFSYTVSSVKNGTEYIQPFDQECMMGVNTCKLDVLFPEGVKKCVRLKGMLFDSKSVNQFRETAEICARVSTEIHVVMVAVILFCILVFIIIVVVVCIFKSVAWTMHVPDKEPNALRLDHNPKVMRHHNKPTEVTSTVSFLKRLSVSSEDDQHSNNDPASPFPDTSHYMGSAFSESSDQELEDAEMIPEGSRTDSDSAGDSVRTECVSLSPEEDEEDEQEFVPAYDRPHAVMVDFGDGDMVTGYKG